MHAKEIIPTVKTTVETEDSGLNNIANIGHSAPKENESAEDSAACIGRAAVCSKIPISSRACASSASFSVS